MVTHEPEFPIDIVYTWVDQSDPIWIRKRQNAFNHLNVKQNCLCRDGIREREFEKLNQLKFSLRSVRKYADFVNKIYIVTDDQTPTWINLEHPKIEIVSHHTIFEDAGKLPSFNSHAIESRLHHIPGLSEHFLYLNEDFFLGRKVNPDDFFLNGKISKFFPSLNCIESTPVSPADLGMTAAAKQGQRLMQLYFDRKISYYISHCPYPLQRSVLYEMEDVFKNEFNETASHQFRHTNDISIPAFLYFYYASGTGRAVQSSLKYMYLDKKMHHFIRKMVFSLFVKRYQSFCINSGHTNSITNKFCHRILAAFLNISFPQTCEFEIDPKQSRVNLELIQNKSHFR